VFPGSFTDPKRVEDLILWQVQMKIYPGSSGSPVFDGMGKLVGIVTGRYRGTDSVGFLIPFGTLMEFLKEM
jgi:serine protease Do